MLRRIAEFLNQPYPDRDDARSIALGSLVVGGIVFGVLYLLRPFGFHELGSGALAVCATFGAITVAVTLAIELFIRFGLGIRRDTPTWTLWKWLLGAAIIIFCIALANYAYLILGFGRAFDWGEFRDMVWGTFAVGIFPTALLGAFNLVQKLKANIAIAESLELPHPIVGSRETIRIPVGQSGEVFEIDPSRILYIEAMQNYAKVHFDADGSAPESELLRATMSSIEDLLIGSTVERCHRSYLVNRARVVAASGNAQGLKLVLRGLDGIEIPVSRKYIETFR